MAREAAARPRPAWWEHSDDQAWNFNPTTFRILRRDCLRLTQDELARYLRVSRASVIGWEVGRQPIPFAAWEAMRLQIENAAFAFSHPQWQGWKIDQRNGHLVSPTCTMLLTPDDLELLTITHARWSIAEARVRALETRIAELTAENTRLRELFLDAGVTDELHQIKARLTDLLSQVGTARVVPMPNNANPERNAA